MSSSSVSGLLRAMSEEKYPTDPVCSKVQLLNRASRSHSNIVSHHPSEPLCKSQCQATKTQADFSLSQLKKHAKRVCAACVAVGVSELAAFRNSHLAKEVASYTAADKVDEALAAAMRRREAKRNASRQGRVHFQMRALQSMIASCCQLVEPWLPQLVEHNAGGATVAAANLAVSAPHNSQPVAALAFSDSMLDMQRFYSPYPSSAPLRSDSRAFTLQWAALPQSVDPSRSGGLTPARAARKRQQVEFVLSYLLTVVAPGAVIVDVGSASGNFSLPLAAALPQCTFVLIDWSDSHLQLAAARAAAAGLDNVRTHLGGIQSLPESFHFDICVAMHACGPASDWAQIQSLRRGATYIICPCCLGKGSTRSEKELKRNERHFEISSSSDAPTEARFPLAKPQTGSNHTQCDLSGDGPHLQRPRSQWGAAALTSDTFVQLAAHADFNAHTSEPDATAASDHSGDVSSADSLPPTSSAAESKCGDKRAAAGLDQCNADDSEDDGDDQQPLSAPGLVGSTSAAPASATTASELARAAGLPRYWAACKALLEMDRSAAALEFVGSRAASASGSGGDNHDAGSYRVALVKMQPPSASVKNDVLLGVTRAQFARLQTAEAARQAATCTNDAYFRFAV